MENYYDVLQVSPKAEPAVITAAYKRLAQTYHPDKSKDPEATAKMAKINLAYDVLSDPAKRTLYDNGVGTGSETQDAGGRHVSDEELMTNLFRFAAEQAAAGKKRQQVADALTKNGVPYDIAHFITEQVFEYRSELRGKEGKKSMGCGLAMLIVGGLITGITYLAASGPGGGTYFVTTGLFIVGTITLIAGIIQYLRS